MIYTVTEEKFGIAPERDSVLKKIVALYVGKSNYIAFGKKGYFSEDRKTAPYRLGKRVMVPIFVFTQILRVGAPSGVKTVCDGNGAEYTDLADACKTYSLWYRVEDNGLAVISREDLGEVLSWTANTRLMRNIPESFIFDDVDGGEMLDLISKRYPSCGHPRLIFTDKKIGRIKKEIASPTGDAVYKRLYARLIACAERFMTEEPSRHELRDGIRLGYVCQENSRRMLTLALAYNLSGERRYAERAYREMLYSASFPDFNPFHFLDVGEMCLGLGLAYDWLYGFMDEAMKEPIRNAIVQKGIYPINEDFDGLPRRRSWNWRGELADNWRLVISGVGVGAMAILDELSGEELEKAKRAAEQTLYDIRRSLSLFAPFGAYEEGVGYWYYGMKYYCYLMQSLLTATGTDFGYVDVVGMRFTNRFLLAMNGPVSAFDYHDCDPKGSSFPPEMMFLADAFNTPEESAARINVILSDAEYDAYRIISDFYAYNPDTMANLRAEGCAPSDVYLPIAEVTSMRNGLGGDALWLGFHCDDPIDGEGHDHMDAGTFVIDALGESFFIELGRDDYNLPNYLQCYRVRAEGHNVMIFNPDGDYCMRYGGRAKICEYGFSDEISYAVGNLSKAYREDFGITSYKRGVTLYKKECAALIVDEVTAEKPLDAFWFAHTRAEICVSDDGKSAVLSQNGKRLYARIIEGKGAKFTVMPAIPLPCSPKIEGQKMNEDVRKLSVRLDGVEKITLAICFSEKENADIEYTPLCKISGIIKEEKKNA
ncbi:MAG: heparinase II/III family protein [Clostridia bacterium]|nr:heparinase II/III family protein [Clostridia bacterium]